MIKRILAISAIANDMETINYNGGIGKKSFSNRNMKKAMIGSDL